jgi:glycine zipper 2TM protein
MMPRTRARMAAAMLLGSAALMLAGCEHGGGTGSAGVGTVAGAVGGAGLGRALFGNSTTGMLIGAAAGGLAGNAVLDRPAEQRRQQEAEASLDAAKRRQLDYERQRALQADEVQRQIEERRLFEQWQRERNANPAPA